MDDGVLLLAPERATWLFLNRCQHALWRRMSSGATIGEAAQDVSCHLNTSADAVVRELQILLSMAHNNGFRSDAEPQDRQFAGELILYLTERCNLRCIHCFVEQETESHGSEFTTGQWVALLNEYAQLWPHGKVLLTGGEPLLHPGVADIARHGADLGLQISVNTNGTILSPKLWAALGPHLWGLQFSLDGFSAPVHEMIRGEGSFARTERAIKTVLQNPGSANMRLSVSVLPLNVQHIREHMLQWLCSVDLHRRLTVVLTPVAPLGRATADTCTKIEDIEEQLEPALLAMNELGWDYDVDASPGIRQHKCGIGEHLVVHATGEMSPCNFSSERRRFASLAEAFACYHDENAQCTVTRSPVCSDCELRFVCFMGCQVRNTIESRGPLEPACTPKRKSAILSRLVRRERIHRAEIEESLDGNAVLG